MRKLQWGGGTCVTCPPLYQYPFVMKSRLKILGPRGSSSPTFGSFLLVLNLPPNSVFFSDCNLSSVYRCVRCRSDCELKCPELVCPFVIVSGTCYRILSAAARFHATWPKYLLYVCRRTSSWVDVSFVSSPICLSGVSCATLATAKWIAAQIGRGSRGRGRGSVLICGSR